MSDKERSEFDGYALALNPRDQAQQELDELRRASIEAQDRIKELEAFIRVWDGWGIKWCEPRMDVKPKEA